MTKANSAPRTPTARIVRKWIRTAARTVPPTWRLPSEPAAPAKKRKRKQ